MPDRHGGTLKYYSSSSSKASTTSPVNCQRE